MQENNVNEIFDKVRKTAAGMGEAAGKAAQDSVKKAGDWVEITKLNFRIFDLTGEVDGMYKELGKLLYSAHANPDSETPDISDKLSAIDGKLAEIKELRRKIDLLKNIKICPECGKKNDKTARFCSGCAKEL